MAWGNKPTGVDDLIAKLKAGDCPSLCVFSSRSLKPQIKEFAAALGANSSCKEILCSGHDIGLEGLRIMGQTLGERNTTVEKLCIGNKDMDDAGAAALLEGLVKNKSLLHLDLEHKSLSEGTHIARFLAGHSALRTLCLGRNTLGDRGLEQLCQGLTSDLEVAPSLTSLDLSSNDITALGAARLASALRTDGDGQTEVVTAAAAAAAALPALAQLDLSENGSIGDESGSALVSSLLPRRGVIQRLVMRECGMAVQTGAALGQFLAHSLQQRLESSGSTVIAAAEKEGGQKGGQVEAALYIDMTRNELGAEGAIVLAANLREGRGASSGATSAPYRNMSLLLAHNNIGDGGAKALSTYFLATAPPQQGGGGGDCCETSGGCGPLLKMLDVSGNDISCEGSASLLRTAVDELRLFNNFMLRQSSSIAGDGSKSADPSPPTTQAVEVAVATEEETQESDHPPPPLPDAGERRARMDEALKALRLNPCIRTLDIGANRLTDLEVAQLCDGLREGDGPAPPRLVTLELGGNAMGTLTEGAIAKLQTANKGLDIAFRQQGNGLTDPTP